MLTSEDDRKVVRAAIYQVQSNYTEEGTNPDWD